MDAQNQPAPNADVVLSARSLRKEFRGFVAVGGVDLDIRRGSIHALIGPNGAGKTTVFPRRWRGVGLSVRFRFRRSFRILP